MVNGDAGYPEGQGDCENCHGDDISGRFATDPLAARDCEVSDEKNDVRHDVDNEAFLARSSAVDQTMLVFEGSDAVEPFDGRCETKHRDEGQRYTQLAQQGRVNLSDELKRKNL